MNQCCCILLLVRNIYCQGDYCDTIFTGYAGNFFTDFFLSSLMSNFKIDGMQLSMLAVLHTNWMT